MKDKYGRNIDYIRISVTDRCNLRCRYCIPDEQAPLLPKEQLLSFDEIVRFCRVLPELGIHRVKLTGGEPFAREDTPRLAAAIKKIDGIFQVTLTTNGTLLAEKIPALEAADVDGVNVSLDTLDEERFRALTRRPYLGQVKAGLEALNASSIPKIKLNCVPLEEINGDELEDIALLAKDGRMPVRFIEMMPVGSGREWTMIPEAAVKERLVAAFGPMTPVEGRLGNGPAAYYRFPAFSNPVGFISAMSHAFCEDCNRIRLTPDGFLRSCLFYGNGVDLKTILREENDDRQLARAVRQAIWEKPKRHPRGPAGEDRKMYQIGG